MTGVWHTPVVADMADDALKRGSIYEVEFYDPMIR